MFSILDGNTTRYSLRMCSNDQHLSMMLDRLIIWMLKYIDPYTWQFELLINVFEQCFQTKVYNSFDYLIRHLFIFLIRKTQSQPPINCSKTYLHCSISYTYMMTLILIRHPNIYAKNKQYIYLFLNNYTRIWTVPLHSYIENYNYNYNYYSKYSLYVTWKSCIVGECKLHDWQIRIPFHISYLDLISKKLRRFSQTLFI